MPSKNKNELYDYQKEDLELILEKISADARGRARLLYQLATGGGKTVVFSELARRFAELTGKRVLVHVPRAVRLNPTYSEFEGIALFANDFNAEPVVTNDELRIVCL